MIFFRRSRLAPLMLQKPHNSNNKKPTNQPDHRDAPPPYLGHISKPYLFNLTKQISTVVNTRSRRRELRSTIDYFAILR